MGIRPPNDLNPDKIERYWSDRTIHPETTIQGDINNLMHWLDTLVSAGVAICKFE